MSDVAEQMQQQTDEFRERYKKVKEEIGKTIVGHEEIVHGVLTSMFVGGHCLLEGVGGQQVGHVQPMRLLRVDRQSSQDHTLGHFLPHDARQ